MVIADQNSINTTIYTDNNDTACGLDVITPARAHSAINNIQQLPKNFEKINPVKQTMIIQNRLNEHYQRYELDLPCGGIVRSYYLICETDDECQLTDFELLPIRLL